MAKTCGTCGFIDPNNCREINTWSNSYKEYYCDKKYRGGYHRETEPACPDYQKRLDIKEDSACFITTTVVDILGYSDDCAILKTLRSFRDNHLQTNPLYEDALKTYDVIGPEISNALRKDPINRLIALSIAHDYLVPICNMIRETRYNLAVDKYKEMVEHLKSRYAIDINANDYEYDENVLQEEKGHARALVKNEAL